MLRRLKRSPHGDEPRIAGLLDLSLIGSGGFSKVYTAHQERFARTVAVKVVSVDLSSDAIRRFEREQATAGQLDGHPNVIRIYESGLTEAGRPYLMMEYHSAGSVADRLRRHGPLPVADVLDLGVKLGGALHAAHRRGIVHRDVKPQNVLLSQFSGPVLADFGIAALDPGRFTVTTEAFSVHHAAPEVLAGGAATPSSDLYSLASTIYELLSGRPPFFDAERPELLALIQRVQHDPVQRISRPDLPADSEAVLVGLLERDPAMRPADGETFADRLRELQASLGLAVSGPTLDESASPVDTADSPWRPPTGSGGALPPFRAAPEPPGGIPASSDATLIPPPRTAVPPDVASPIASTNEASADEDGYGVDGASADGATTVHRQRAPIVVPPAPDEHDAPNRSRWIWMVPVGVLALAVGVGISLVRGGDEVADEPSAPSVTLPPDRVGPCPSDPPELELSSGSIDDGAVAPPTDVVAGADPAQTSRAIVSWTDTNNGAATYSVILFCRSSQGTELVPVGLVPPGAEPSVTVDGLAPPNYCFSVGALRGDERPMTLGSTPDGDTRACLDE